MKTITQSPNWDHKLSLEQLLKEAKFFILTKRDSGLVDIISKDRYTLFGKFYYDFCSLSHDRYGVTYDADGTVAADFVGQQIEAGLMEITKDPEVALKWIAEVMYCGENVSKLFTEYIA